MKSLFHYLYLDEGTDFESQELYWMDASGNPVDLTNYTFTAKMNKHADSDPTLSPPISFGVNVVDAINGEYTLTLPSNQPVSHITYIFDVIAQPSSGGRKAKIAEGQVIVRPGI